MQTVAQLFAAGSNDASVNDLLSDMAEEDGDSSASADDASAAADNELVKLVNRIIIDAHRQGASDIHIEPRPGKEKNLDPVPQGWLPGALHRNSGELPQSDRHADQDHVRPGHFGAAQAHRTARSSSGVSPRSISNCGWPRYPRRGGMEDVGDASAGQQRTAAAGAARAAGEQLRAPEADHRQALRHLLRVRSDRFGQDHHAALHPSVRSIRRKPRSGPPKIRWKSPRRGCARCR